MTATLDKLHVDAGVDLLRAYAAAQSTPIPVYPDAGGFVPTGELAPPYYRWYSSIERPPGIEGTANALDGLSVSWTTRWYLHCVGDTEYAAIALAGGAVEAMLNKRPTVAGRSTGLIYQEASEPTRRDTSNGEERFDRPIVFAMQTAPG